MKVVVFGASGFVGGWICEELLKRDDVQLHACVRRWAASVRVARHGVDLSQIDLDEDSDLSSVLLGADAVINATVPQSNKEPDAALRLYLACHEAGVRRFVQFSSIAVYGDTRGRINEDAPLAPIDDYGRGKAEMEHRLLEAAIKGGPSLVILRPSIIYGPFSDTWTVRYAQRIAKGRWRGLGWHGTGTCNLVYAQDVARSAIVAATGEPGGKTQILNINGPEIVSWNEYIEKFGDALQVPGRETPGTLRMGIMVYGSKAIRVVGKWLLTHFKNTIRGATQSGSMGPAVMAGAKALADLYPTPGEMELLRRSAVYNWERAERELKFTPSMRLDEGLRQTAIWCRRHGVVDLD